MAGDLHERTLSSSPRTRLCPDVHTDDRYATFLIVPQAATLSVERVRCGPAAAAAVAAVTHGDCAGDGSCQPECGLRLPVAFSIPSGPGNFKLPSENETPAATISIVAHSSPDAHMCPGQGAQVIRAWEPGGHRSAEVAVLKCKGVARVRTMPSEQEESARNSSLWQ
jgi:hypothetical protein